MAEVTLMKLKIATTQYGLDDIGSESRFWTRIEEKTKEAAGAGAGLIVFPEYMTAHLLSLVPSMSHEGACGYLADRTDEYARFFAALSAETGIAILAGTHVARVDGGYANRAYLFFPDGRIERQDKVHLTPEEQNHWPLIAGEELNVFDTAWGKTTILICYDIEFPELARAAAVRGAELLLCPSYTETAFGYYRVRYCAQARAVENQLFVALSGLAGELTEERPQIDRAYSLAGTFAPCDYPFVPDGVLALGESSEDATVLAEVDFELLRENRERGAVAPFFDRRPELYERELRKASVE
ncbi:carbon-nitrogen hydrolase family protein [Cohnella suwonensis]|uniref:Carbon-nitrogen hydrolase family protein n=1 Tax=Cohnella suwonensis TaxID=696072 RepID=A0ABW0LYX0_9BACL